MTSQWNIGDVCHEQIGWHEDKSIDSLGRSTRIQDPLEIPFLLPSVAPSQSPRCDKTGLEYTQRKDIA